MVSMATVTAHMRGARGAVKSHGPGDSCGSESEREIETFRLSVPTWHRSLDARGPMNALKGSDDVSERITPMPAVTFFVELHTIRSHAPPAKITPPSGAENFGSPRPSGPVGT